MNFKDIFENVMVDDPFTDYTDELKLVWTLPNFQTLIQNIIEENKHRFFAIILSIDIPEENLQIICDILCNYDDSFETIWKSSENSENYERILKLFTILLKNKKVSEILQSLKNKCDFSCNCIKIMVLEELLNNEIY